MEHEEIVNTILDKLDWFYEDIARKKHGAFKGWSKGELISLIILHGTGPKVVAAFGCGDQAFNRTVKEHLVPIFGPLKGGGESWKSVLLNFVKVKRCPHCQTYKPYTDFYTDKSKSYGIDKVCKKCKIPLNKSNYIKYSVYIKMYRLIHRTEYAARNAKRRANKLKATPNWANLIAIKEIYRICPEGYHVDHIVPLQGKLVCGLHCEFNLQHLPAKENLSKGNRFLPE